jgi:hypothetical protein
MQGKVRCVINVLRAIRLFVNPVVVVLASAA